MVETLKPIAEGYAEITGRRLPPEILTNFVDGYIASRKRQIDFRAVGPHVAGQAAKWEADGVLEQINELMSLIRGKEDDEKRS